jgi:uncharacterized membrane protein (UPF0127 family)
MITFLEFIDHLKLRFIAKTPKDRAKGLMHQIPLASNEGVLFIYDVPTKAKFWNKNVNFPIQIGFFDQQHRLVSIEHLNAEQRESVGCNSFYRYALETFDGFFDNIPIGTLLEKIIKIP